jgi:hypothetical protein
MKKSEMILLIEKKFNISDNCYYLTELLDFLVSQGMQPPRHVKFAPTAYAEPNKRVVYEWEPENEE